MTSTHTLRRGIVGLATAVLVSGGLGWAGLNQAANSSRVSTQAPQSSLRLDVEKVPVTYPSGRRRVSHLVLATFAFHQ